jgi:hypothetical protein
MENTEFYVMQSKPTKIDFYTHQKCGFAVMRGEGFAGRCLSVRSIDDSADFSRASNENGSKSK